MEQSELERLEAITEELIAAFSIKAPPVPVEEMLRQPLKGMWDVVDINQLSTTFLSIKDPYSPRMSVARLLARHIAYSEWGRSRGVPSGLAMDENAVHLFARMLIMPRSMIESMTASSRNSATINQEFEVPEDDARARLADLID